MSSIGYFLTYGALGLTTLLNIIVPVSGSSVVTPLLALLTDPHRAIGIVSAFFVMSGIVRTFTFRSSIRWSEVRVLRLPSVIAATFGAFALVTIPTPWLLLIILAFSAYFLLKKLGVIPKGKGPSSLMNHFVGVLSGFLQGTGLTGSDLRNQYLYAHDLSIAEVHGTTSLIGTSNFLMATVVRLYTNQLSLPDITPLLYLFPIVLLATWAGKHMLFKVPAKISNYIIIGVMVAVVTSLSYKIFVSF